MPGVRDDERLQRIADALRERNLDAVVCTLPTRVLLMSGYWPVIGTSFAIASRDAQVMLLVPEDELQLAQHGYADDISHYHPSTLERIQTVEAAALAPLQALLLKLQLSNSRIGIEAGPASEPASYSGMNLFGGSIREILHQAVPRARLQPADDVMEKLAAVKTPRELEHIRSACRIAGAAFEDGSRHFAAGMPEFEAASLVRAGFSRCEGHGNVRRADGFAWCMSGPNSAEASGAYARSRDRKIATGDLVLLHANSYADGYWTDITRTYTLGEPSERQREIHEAAFEARQAALAAIRPGVAAREVDLAAREVFGSHGVAKHFKHSTGHGVGFAAISANARPRIHPASQETLETGMVFNVEPALYFDGYGGVRHCDMVAVGEKAAELLTPFQCQLSQLIVENISG